MEKNQSLSFLKAIAGVTGTVLVLSSQLANAAQCPAIKLGDKHPAATGKDMRTKDTQPWCDPVCVNVLANGTACNNAAGQVVTTMGICNDGQQVRESILDIEYNLCIDVDDQFIDDSDYVGQPPGVNYSISADDAKLYFAALFAEDKNGNGVIDGAEATEARDRGIALANELNTNGDGIITRNEASMAKGADPCQLLSTGFSSGLATDDILSYVGLYLGDPMIDKYAGDLETHIKDNMLAFTRTWQPSYWKNEGNAIGSNPNTVTAFYDDKYDGNSYRVCDANYNGKFKELVSIMNGGSHTGGGNSGGNTGGNTGGDNGGNTGGDTGGNTNNNCPSSHPNWCAAKQQCFTDSQMNAYCN